MPRVIGGLCRDVAPPLRAAGYQVRLEGGPLAEILGSVEKQNPEPGKPLQAGQEIVLTCKQ
jgi:hypothetical protein